MSGTHHEFFDGGARGVVRFVDGPHHRWGNGCGCGVICPCGCNGLCGPFFGGFHCGLGLPLVGSLCGPFGIGLSGLLLGGRRKRRALLGCV